jgi:hypothetical protein
LGAEVVRHLARAGVTELEVTRDKAERRSRGNDVDEVNAARSATGGKPISVA